ncbi:MAG: hypothetical protein AAFQ43_00285 [Bacteroidota bacterium]
MRHTLSRAVGTVLTLFLFALLLTVPEAAAAGGSAVDASGGTAAFLVEHIGWVLGAGLAVGISVVEGITETSTPDSHKVRHVDSRLTMKATQVNPFNTTLRRLRRTKRRATNEKVEYETDAHIPRKVLVSAQTAGVGPVNTAVTFTSAQAHYLREDDLLLMPGNATAPGGTLLVTGTTETTVTVVRVDGNSANQDQWGSVPQLEAGESLVRMGNNKEEFFTFSRSRATMPTQDFNYIEEVDASLDISDRRMGTSNYTRNDYKRNRDHQTYDFLSNSEFKLFFAPREKKVIGGKNRTVAGGMDFFNPPKQLTYSAATLSDNTIIDWHRTLFSDNRGSDTRIAFHDPVFGTDLAKMNGDKVRFDRYVSKTLKYGVTRTTVTGCGTIIWVPNLMFQEAGYTRICRVVDLANVDFVPFRGMKVTKRNLRKAEGRAGMSIHLDEAYTVLWRYMETHGAIEGTA